MTFLQNTDESAALQRQAALEREYDAFTALSRESVDGSPSQKIFDIIRLEYGAAANIDTSDFKFEGWPPREIAKMKKCEGITLICGILANQSHELSLRAYIEGKVYLKARINPAMVTSKDGRRANRDQFKDVVTDELFRAVHMTGNQDMLAQAIAVQPPILPDSITKSYSAWKTRNGKFIKEAAEHVAMRERIATAPNNDVEVIRDQFERLKELRHSPKSTPEEKAFYDLYIYQQNKWPFCIDNKLYVETFHTLEQRELIDQNIPRFFCKYVLVHHEQLGIKAKRFAAAQVETWLLEPDIFIEAMKYNLDDLPYIIKICGLEDDIRIDWQKFNDLYVQAKIATQSEVNAGPRVTHIDVDHDLVVSGTNDKSIGYMAVDEKLDDTAHPAGNDEDDNENRTQKLEDWLKSISNSGIQEIFVRRCTRVLTEDGRKRKPYNLVDIHMADNEIIRVAVCDYRCHMTFVERGAAPYVENQALKLSELRKNDRVWRAIHFTDTQWFEKLHGIVFTPVADMKVEDKTRSAWASLKGELASSFAGTLMATGTIPPKTSNAHFEYGPLAGKTTLSRGFHAAYKGNIDGIPEGTTYNKMFDLLAKGDKALMPHLARFLNKPPVTDAMILTACDEYKREMGQPIEPDVFELLLIDVVDTRMSESDADMRRRGPDIDLAFKAKAVHIPAEKVATWGKYPSGLQEFLELENILPAPAPTAV